MLAILLFFFFSPGQELFLGNRLSFLATSISGFYACHAFTSRYPTSVPSLLSPFAIFVPENSTAPKVSVYAYQEEAFSGLKINITPTFFLGPPLSDYLNNPAPTTTAYPQRSSVVGTRSAGAPLKRSLSEIDGAGAKTADKKIQTNRPAAAYLTNSKDKNKNNKNKKNNNNPNNLLLQQQSSKQLKKNVKAAMRDLRTPGEITFVRSRMFYSKPAYNGRGGVVFGLRHIRMLPSSLFLFLFFVFTV